jgi:hypothetical protein
MEVKKVRILLTHAGQTAHYNVDLLLEPGQPPLAVLEWREEPDGANSPAVAIQLESQWLHPLQGWGTVTHMYEMAVESPMPLR